MKILIGMSLMIAVSFGAVYAIDSHKNYSSDQTPILQNNRICPVMRGNAKKEYPATYNGKTYYLCCPSCLAEFNKDPEKYISRIKEFAVEAFSYSFSPNIIKVKQGDIVRLAITSRDGEHGVKIKDYSIDVTVNKGEVKKREFVADKSGEFTIECPVYCGTGHSSMKAKLIIEK